MSAEKLSLPKASVARRMKEECPHMQVSADAIEIALACCSEFIQLVGTESNEVCEKSKKKTIQPEHVASALETLGFSDFQEQVGSITSEFKEEKQNRRKERRERKKSALDGMTYEEAVAMQQQMFAASRANFEAGDSAMPP